MQAITVALDLSGTRQLDDDDLTQWDVRVFQASHRQIVIDLSGERVSDGGPRLTITRDDAIRLAHALGDIAGSPAPWHPYWLGSL